MGYIRILKDHLVCLKIVPNGHSNDEYSLDLAKAIAELYQPLSARISFSRRGIQFNMPDHITWETELKNGHVNYYLICPKRLVPNLKFKIHSVWPNATIEKVNLPTDFGHLEAAVCEMKYTRQDIFSLNTEGESGTAEMLFKIAQGISGHERALIQVQFDPIDQDKWHNKAGQINWAFLRGAMKMPSQIKKRLLGRCTIGEFLCEMIQLLFKASGFQSISTKDVEYERSSRLLMLRKTTDPTKPESMAIRTFIRVAAESHDKARAVRIINAIAIAYKQLNGDNELERKDRICFRNSFLRDINRRRPPMIKVNGNIMSVKECSKLMDLN
ncbi:MAG: hypothetical protein GX348_03850 [Veillonellaceae bacterium]|jgi:hypothetical protein|nr:hypothetical protein [Veillonellaceae bacterium]